VAAVGMVQRGWIGGTWQRVMLGKWKRSSGSTEQWTWEEQKSGAVVSDALR